MVDNNPQYYSILDACNQLNISFHKMYEWVQDGQIKTTKRPLHSKRPCYAIGQAELDRLKTLLNPPADCINVIEFAKANHMVRGTIDRYIQKLHLKPVLTHQVDQISPQNSYYHQSDLAKINQYLIAQSKSVQKYHLQINTDQVYDPKHDMSVYQLQNQLDDRYPLGRRMIVDWIRRGYLKDHYQIDHNGKIFFTKADARWIKARYAKMPDNVTYNNVGLAKKLHIFPTQLMTFRKFYHLPTIKILGYNGVYYTDQTAKKIIDWYQHPSHRPYPMQWQN